MDIQLDFNTLKQICKNMGERILGFQTDELVYICDSGMGISHLIKQETNLPIGFYKFVPAELNIDNYSQKIVFIDSYLFMPHLENIRKFMKQNCPEIEWRVASVVISDTIDISKVPELLTYGIRSPFSVLLPF
jgi:hypothetical protein